jgi:hypothetical protein
MYSFIMINLTDYFKMFLLLIPVAYNFQKRMVLLITITIITIIIIIV